MRRSPKTGAPALELGAWLDDVRLPGNVRRSRRSSFRANAARGLPASEVIALGMPKRGCFERVKVSGVKVSRALFFLRYLRWINKVLRGAMGNDGKRRAEGQRGLDAGERWNGGLERPRR